MPFKANNNREAVVVCARHVVKRPSKRSVLVISNMTLTLQGLTVLYSGVHLNNYPNINCHLWSEENLLCAN